MKNITTGLLLLVAGLAFGIPNPKAKGPVAPEGYILLPEVSKQDIMNAEREYCQEIDSLVTAMTGIEIDADSVDVDNATDMEFAAYDLLGDYFYTWKSTKSKKSWALDVLIARYCY